MLCDDLEGWDGEGGREAQEGGDMGIYVCIWLIHFVVQQKKQTNKQTNTPAKEPEFNWIKLWSSLYSQGIIESNRSAGN